MKGRLYKIAELFEQMAYELKSVAYEFEGEFKMPTVEVATKEPSITATEVEVTIEDVRSVLAEKSQAGLTGKVKELLNSYGVNKLSEIKKSDYADLLVKAKKLK
jgi:hypothetical protein